MPDIDSSTPGEREPQQRHALDGQGLRPCPQVMADGSGDAARPLNGAAAALSWFARRTAPPEPADRPGPFGAGHPPPRYLNEEGK